MDHIDFQVQKDKAYDHFWYKARRVLIDYLLAASYKESDPGRKILEVGCGTGYQLPVLTRWGDVAGCDINPEAIRVARDRGFAVRECDVENDPMPEASWDVVCLLDVLEHLEKAEAALERIRLALKAGGRLFLTVPAYQFLFSSHDLALSHYRRYGRRELCLLLERLGFKIEKIGYWNSLLFPLILVLRIAKKCLNIFIKPLTPRSEAVSLPPIINDILYRLLMFENFIIKRNFRFPWGLSIFVIAKRR